MVSLDSYSGVLSLEGAHEMDNSCIFAINMRPLGSHREVHPSSPSPLLPPPFPPASPPAPPPSPPASPASPPLADFLLPHWLLHKLQCNPQQFFVKYSSTYFI